MTDPPEIPGAPPWAQEFYRRIHADVMLVHHEYVSLRSRLEALERWRHSVEAERETDPPGPMNAE